MGESRPHQTKLTRKLFAGQLTPQPRPRKPPVQLNSAGRDIQDARHRVHIQSCEVSQHHHLRCARCFLFQALQRLVQRKQFGSVQILFAGRQFVARPDGATATATLRAPATTCVIHADPAHCLCCGREEMSGAVPIHMPVTDQAEVGLMHKDSRLKLATAWFSAHLAMRNTTQFVVHRPPELFLSSLVTHARCSEQSRQRILHSCGHAVCPIRRPFYHAEHRALQIRVHSAARSVHVSRVWGNFFAPQDGRLRTYGRMRGVGHGRHQSRHRPSDGPRMLDRRPKQPYATRTVRVRVGQSTQVH